MLDPVAATDQPHVAPRVTAGRTLDGGDLLAAFRAGVAQLEAHVDEVNRLNVYPVPDGDTGSNMLATITAALVEAKRARAGSRSPGVGTISAALADGALIGARGNSGVILSQVLAGFAEALSGRRRAGGADLALALGAGSRRAYDAVGQPVEGTILTVIREAAAAAAGAATRTDDASLVLAAAVDAARLAVAKTPSLLAVLREANVVDAGGDALFLLLDGALSELRGESAPGVPALGRRATGARIRVGSTPPGPVAAGRAGEGHVDHGYGFETTFIVRARRGAALDLAAIRTQLETIGQSVVVAGDERMAKVHVHSSRPRQILAAGRAHGVLSQVSVEDLDTQAAALHLDTEGHVLGLRAAVTVEPPSTRVVRRRPAQSAVAAPAVPLAVVAIAPGAGFDAAFTSFGAVTVRGGQPDDPTAAEIAAAIERAAAREVIVLPNGSNAILAVREAAALVTSQTPATTVHVVPTRNAAEGLAAMIELDPRRPAIDNLAAMSTAARVSTIRSTEAARDATMAETHVRQGQTVVLDADDRVLAVDGDENRAILAALGALAAGQHVELVTIYHGASVRRDDAERLAGLLRAARPAIEVVLVDGGQRHDRYVISAE